MRAICDPHHQSSRPLQSKGEPFSTKDRFREAVSAVSFSTCYNLSQLHSHTRVLKRMNSFLVVVTSLSLASSNAFVVPQGVLSAAAREKTPVALQSTVSSNEDLKPGIAAINASNEQMIAQLNQLRNTQDFRLYSVDILASCEYMPQELFECYSETCEVYPVDEDEVCTALWRVHLRRA